MNSNGQADIGYWQMIERQKDPVAWMVKTNDGKKLMLYGEEQPPKFADEVQAIPLYTHPSEHDLGIAEAIGFEKGYNTNKLDDLTKEEILCLWDWWSGEILSTDILDFADTYKRVLLGEEGLLEWHQEYVKRMNNERK
jgi:hypothetical protein